MCSHSHSAIGQMYVPCFPCCGKEPGYTKQDNIQVVAAELLGPNQVLVKIVVSKNKPRTFNLHSSLTKPDLVFTFMLVCAM